MAKVLLDMAISIDGYICRPDGSDGGLYDWYFAPSEASAPVVAELAETTGAIVVGRGAFGVGEDASGWDDTPYQVKHFVITHRPPTLPKRSVEFVFVEGDLREIIALAAQEAGDRYVTVGGGADIARQLLAAGLVDELQLHVVPVIFGSGVPLFTSGLFGSDDEIGRWSKIRVVDAPNVTHLRWQLDRVS
jgi:dihydrofolate reductase